MQAHPRLAGRFVLWLDEHWLDCLPGLGHDASVIVKLLLGIGIRLTESGRGAPSWLGNGGGT